MGCQRRESWAQLSRSGPHHGEGCHSAQDPGFRGRAYRTVRFVRLVPRSRIVGRTLYDSTRRCRLGTSDPNRPAERSNSRGRGRSVPWDWVCTAVGHVHRCPSIPPRADGQRDQKDELTQAGGPGVDLQRDRGDQRQIFVARHLFLQGPHRGRCNQSTRTHTAVHKGREACTGRSWVSVGL